MIAKCIKHNIRLIQTEESDTDSRVVKCPVDYCTTGFNLNQFVNLCTGSKKPTDFGYRLERETKDSKG